MDRSPGTAEVEPDRPCTCIYLHLTSATTTMMKSPALLTHRLPVNCTSPSSNMPFGELSSGVGFDAGKKGPRHGEVGEIRGESVASGAVIGCHVDPRQMLGEGERKKDARIPLCVSLTLPLHLAILSPSLIPPFALLPHRQNRQYFSSYRRVSFFTSPSSLFQSCKTPTLNQTQPNQHRHNGAILHPRFPSHGTPP